MASRELAIGHTQANGGPMAQDDCITTAIRKLMSCGQLLKSTNPVRLACIEFVAAGDLGIIRHAAGDMREYKTWRAS